MKNEKKQKELKKKKRKDKSKTERKKLEELILISLGRRFKEVD